MAGIDKQRDRQRDRV